MITTFTGLIALATAVSACSSSGSKSNEGGGAGSSAGGGSTTSTQASGTPIKVLITIEDFGSQSDLHAGADMAVKALNAAGGIKGHPVQVVYCDHQSADNNTAATCISKALSDPEVVAAAASQTTASAVTTPLLEKTGIACLGCQMFGPADFKSPSFFTDQAGFLATNLEVKMAQTVLNAQRTAVPYRTDTGGSLPGLIESTKPAGTTQINVPFNPAQTDQSSTAAKMLSQHPDAIIQGLPLPNEVKLLLASQSQGANIPFIVTAQAVGPNSTASRLAGVTSPVYVMSVVDRTSPGFQDYQADVAKYDKGQDSTDTAINGWLSVKLLLASVANSLPSGAAITRQAVFDAANKLSSVTTNGLLPPLDWTKPRTYLGGTVTRGFNVSAFAYKYTDGKFVPVGSRFSLFQS